MENQIHHYSLLIEYNSFVGDNIYEYEDERHEDPEIIDMVAPCIQCRGPPARVCYIFESLFI